MWCFQDMTVRLWDPDTGRQLASCPVEAQGNDSSNNDQKVAVVAIAVVQTGSDCLLVVQVHRYVGSEIPGPLADKLLARSYHHFMYRVAPFIAGG